MIPSNLVSLFINMRVALTVVVVIDIAAYRILAEIVQTSYGPVRGEELSFEGTKYKAFKGMPYAAPPVGELRFRGPQPPETWSSVRDATKFGKICHQQRMTSTTSEDCLTLNVFTPSLDEKDLKAVLVYIHGGGFLSGDGTDSLYGPYYLIQEDIVVVTFNYRLGPLGFLSTNTPDASGNWGLKDQAFALRWVQENIAKFGGDPNRVGIYGNSAGGTCVHLHLFSPLSEGLFHKVIVSSGPALSTWPINKPNQMEKFSINMARILGASESQIQDPARRIQFLRTADSKTMTEWQRKVADEEDLEGLMIGLLPFVPITEAPGSRGAFLPEDPKKLLDEGRYTKVPIMMGTTDLEGGIMFPRTETRKNISLEDIRNFEKNVCLFLPEPLKSGVISHNGCLRVAQDMRNVYFDGKPFDSSLLNFVYLYGDIIIERIRYCQRKHALNMYPDAPIYNYYFTFDGKWNYHKQMANITLPGASHADDLTYVFTAKKANLPNLPPTSPEVIIKNRMIRFIANFIKYGHPTPSVSDLTPVKWEPATANKPNTMVINNDLKLLENEHLKTRMDMWDRLYEDYNGQSPF